MKDRLTLKNMAFYAFHGDDKNEQELGQRYEVDVDVLIDIVPAAQEDNLRFAVNYKSIFLAVEKCVTGRRFNLIETLAEHIADALLEQFSIQELSIAVRKLKPPVHGIIDYVEIAINRKRHAR